MADRPGERGAAAGRPEAPGRGPAEGRRGSRDDAAPGAHARSPLTVLLISNGHGEDAVGARLARALHARRPEARLIAFPTVGRGEAYRGGPARRVGPLRAMPSGGTMMRAGDAVVRDLRAGFVGMTLAQLRDLRAARADAVIAIGDVWVQALGLLPRAPLRFAVQTLVSVRLDDGTPLGLRAFRERFTPPERALMRAYRRVYVRDGDSAAWLRGRGVTRAVAPGNPMMDELDAAPLALPPLGAGGEPDASGDAGAGSGADAAASAGLGPSVAEESRIVALPGTRGEAEGALRVMAGALGRLPAARVVVPWGASGVPELPGWEPLPTAAGSRAWRRGGATLHLVGGDRFAAALAWAQLALGTSGTAHEQAAGRGLPVVTFPHGDVHPPAFVANQKRLLGDALEVVTADPAAIAAALARLAADPDERARRGAAGRARMGSAGGSAAVAADVLGVLDRAVAVPVPDGRGAAGS